MEVYVFLEDSRVPTRESWQQAIEEAGCPVILGQELDLHKDAGFSPTIYKGQNSGFEIYLDPAASCLDNYPEIAVQVGCRDKCVAFRWGGDLVEAAAAISCSAVLAKLTDGIFYDPDCGQIHTADTVLGGMQEYLSGLE